MLTPTGTALRAARLDRGLSLREAAAQIGGGRGLNWKTLARLESGQTKRPTPRVGMLVARFYGLAPTSLWPIAGSETVNA